MSMNEPYYNKTESDLKFETMQLKLDNKLDRMLAGFEILAGKVDTGFQRVDSEIGSMKDEINGLRQMFFVTNVALVIAFIGVVFPIAWALWGFILKIPFGK